MRDRGTLPSLITASCRLWPLRAELGRHSSGPQKRAKILLLKGRTTHRTLSPNQLYDESPASSHLHLNTASHHRTITLSHHHTITMSVVEASSKRWKGALFDEKIRHSKDALNLEGTQ